MVSEMMGERVADEQIVLLRELERQQANRGQGGLGLALDKLLTQVGRAPATFPRPERATDPFIQVRIEQARRLWQYGFAHALDQRPLTYFDSIPEVPESLRVLDPDLPHLTLVEPRVGVQRACGLIGVDGCKDKEVFPLPGTIEFPKSHPFWVRHDDGRSTRDLRAKTALDGVSDGVHLAPIELGVFAMLYHSQIFPVWKHGLLPGGNHAIFFHSSSHPERPFRLVGTRNSRGLTICDSGPNPSGRTVDHGHMRCRLA